MKKAIAMRCTQEYFEAIKPKLEGLEIKHIDDFKSCMYLTNNGGNISNLITNVANAGLSYGNREFYEEWNEKVFLEACGITIEPKHVIDIPVDSILKILDQNGEEKPIHEMWVDDVNQLADLYLNNKPNPYVSLVSYNNVVKKLEEYRIENTKLKLRIEELKNLPLAKNDFEPLPRDFTGWAKNEKYPAWLGYYEKGFLKYGISDDKKQNEWFLNTSDESCYQSTDEPATESEIFEALKNEAVKRGYKKGNHKCLNSPIIESHTDDVYELENGLLWYGGKYANCVFKDGEWAEIISTITRKEAENKLGVKIVD